MINIIQHNTVFDISDKGTIVVTHDGIFHSDEVFAVALLYIFHKNINVIRTRDTSVINRAINSANTFVLDIGGVYDPQNRNFDHHQKNSPKDLSTVALLFNYLFPGFKSDAQLKLIYERLIKVINDWDQGKTNRFNSFQYLPQIILGFNRNNNEQNRQFLKAVDFAYQILGNEFNTTKEILNAKNIWKNKKIVNGNTVLLTEHCTFWRTIQGKNPTYKFIIQPINNNWCITSVDSEKYPLPRFPELQKEVIFHHKEGFITIFNDLDATIKFAKKLSKFSRHDKPLYRCMRP